MEKVSGFSEADDCRQEENKLCRFTGQVLPLCEQTICLGVSKQEPLFYSSSSYKPLVCTWQRYLALLTSATQLVTLRMTLQPPSWTLRRSKCQEIKEICQEMKECSSKWAQWSVFVRRNEYNGLLMCVWRPINFYGSV